MAPKRKKAPDAVVVPANRWEVFPLPKQWQKTKMTPVVRAGTTFAVGYVSAPKDAVLMAAAPELADALAAAERLLNHMGDILNGMDAVEEEDVEMSTPIFEQVRAALIKAGRKPAKK